jgi:predicted RNA-binding protein with PUA-like domain
MRHWLIKSEPSSFSWDDLWKLPTRTTSWEGVRNYQARNFLRDMRIGDLAFFYHSSAEPNAIIGVAEIVREAYPDPTQFDTADDHHDPKSKRDAPTWVTVDVRAREPLARPVTLAELRTAKGLEKMELLRKGSRLSVTPVSPAEWAVVCKIGGLTTDGRR